MNESYLKQAVHSSTSVSNERIEFESPAHQAMVISAPHPPTPPPTPHPPPHTRKPLEQSGKKTYVDIISSYAEIISSYIRIISNYVLFTLLSRWAHIYNPSELLTTHVQRTANERDSQPDWRTFKI